VYRNPATGEEMPIANAMNDGLIVVDFTTKTRSVEQTKAVGLITIRTIVRCVFISAACVLTYQPLSPRDFLFVAVLLSF